MIDKNIREKAMGLRYSKQESIKISNLLDKLRYVSDVIPVDVMTMEIVTNSKTGERFFINGDRKVILPKSDADEVCHQNFNRDYKVLDDNSSVVERYFELDATFISTIIETMELFIVAFENEIMNDELTEKYEQYISLAESLVLARFDNDVMEALNYASEVVNDSSNYENILYLHQVDAYNIFTEKLSQINGGLVSMLKGA